MIGVIENNGNDLLILLNFLVWPLSVPIILRGKESMTYAATYHQGMIKMYWLNFWGAVMLSLVVHSHGDSKSCNEPTIPLTYTGMDWFHLNSYLVLL